MTPTRKWQRLGAGSVLRMIAEVERRELHIDGRTVVVFEGLAVHRPPLTLFWVGGTPHTGAPLPPHLETAAARGIRLVSTARAGFGGSTRVPGRSVASAAADIIRVADALGVDRFAVMGYSGGGPHALATAALAGSRVAAVATFGSPAPYRGDVSWFDGMSDPGALASALQGRESRERWGQTAQFDPEQFIADDYAALAGALTTLGDDAGRAAELESCGSVDDDVALVSPWGIDLGAVTAHVQVVHGTHDRVIPPAHARLIADACRSSEAIMLSGRGHVGVLLGWEDVLDRMLEPPRPSPDR